MHLKSYPIKGSKLADGTNVTGRTIISQGWSKPLLIGTKLGKSFSHYYRDNVSAVEQKRRESKVCSAMAVAKCIGRWCEKPKTRWHTDHLFVKKKWNSWEQSHSCTVFYIKNECDVSEYYWWHDASRILQGDKSPFFRCGFEASSRKKVIPYIV